MNKIIIRKPTKIVRTAIIQEYTNRKNNYSNVDTSKYNIGIFLHLYYLDTFDYFVDYLNKSNLNFTLYVNLVKGSSDNKSLIDKIKSLYPNSKIIISENVGKDIGGKLNLLKKWNETLEDFDYLIFCHDKKSPHMKDGNGLIWRNQLINGILSDTAIKMSISLLENSRVGMTGSRKWIFTGTYDDNKMYGNVNNKKFLLELLKKFNVKKLNTITFVGGTMFWVKSSIFKEFFTIETIDNMLKILEVGDVKEPSMTHAIERLFGCIVLDKNYTIEKTI